MSRITLALFCIAISYALVVPAGADEAQDRIARIEAAVAAQVPIVVEGKVLIRFKTGTVELSLKNYRTAGQSGTALQGGKQDGVIPSYWGILSTTLFDPLKPIPDPTLPPGPAPQGVPGDEKSAGGWRVLPVEQVDHVDCDVVEITEAHFPANNLPGFMGQLTCKRRVRKLYIGKDNLIHRITGTVIYTQKPDQGAAKPGAAPEPDQEATFEVQVTSYHKPLAVNPRPNSQPPVQTTKMEQQISGAFAISPDGKRCAVSAQDDDIHLLDVETGKESRVLSGHLSPVTALTFTPDSHRLVSVDGLVMAVWDVDAGKLIYTKPLVQQTSGLLISPDGKTLVMTAMNGPLQVLDLQTGKSLCKLEKLSATQIAYAPDGGHLAAVTFNGLKLVDTRTWTVETSWTRVLNFPQVAYSPDGTLLAICGWNGPLLVCDGHTGKEIRTITDEIGLPSNVWFSADSRNLIVLDSDRRGDIPTNAPGVMTWDTTTWQVKQSLNLNGGESVQPRFPGFNGNTLFIGARLAQLDPARQRLKFWTLPPVPERP